MFVAAPASWNILCRAYILFSTGQVLDQVHKPSHPTGWFPVMSEMAVNFQSNAKKKRRKESLIWEMMVIMLKVIADAICSKKVFASNSCNFSVFGDRWKHPLIQIPTWFKLKGGHFLNHFFYFRQMWIQDLYLSTLVNSIFQPLRELRYYIYHIMCSAPVVFRLSKYYRHLEIRFNIWIQFKCIALPESSQSSLE